MEADEFVGDREVWSIGIALFRLELCGAGI